MAKIIPKLTFKERLVKMCLKDGAFLLSCGKMSSQTLDANKLLTDISILEDIVSCQSLSLGKLDAIDGVVGIAHGGTLYGYELAKSLDIPFLLAVPRGGEDINDFYIRNDEEIKNGGSYIIADDVYTTGKSISLVTSALIGESALFKPSVTLSCVIFDRSEGGAPSSVNAFIKHPIPLWERA